VAVVVNITDSNKDTGEVGIQEALLSLWLLCCFLWCYSACSYLWCTVKCLTAVIQKLRSVCICDGDYGCFSCICLCLCLLGTHSGGICVPLNVCHIPVTMVR